MAWPGAVLRKFCSSTVTRSPRRAAQSAANRPTGPAPTTRIWVLSTGARRSMVELMARVVDGTQKTGQRAMCPGLTDWTQRLQLAPSSKRKRCAEREPPALYCDSELACFVQSGAQRRKCHDYRCGTDFSENAAQAARAAASIARCLNEPLELFHVIADAAAAGLPALGCSMRRCRNCWRLTPSDPAVRRASGAGGMADGRAHSVRGEGTD